MKTINKSFLLAFASIMLFANCTHDNDPICVDDGIGEGPESDATELLVKKFSTAPIFDGEIDEVWSEARPLLSTASVSTAGDRIITLNGSSNGDITLEPNDLFDPYTGEGYKYSLKGGHDGEYLYLLFEWDDETDSRDRQSWYFDSVASKWKQENKYANHKNDKFYEDKFGMMFPIGSPEGFAGGTCAVTCHRGLELLDDSEDLGHKVTRHYMKNEGEFTDFWHWKRDRHALAQACDDGFVQWEEDEGFASANGRKNDSDVSPYSTSMKFKDEATGFSGPKYVIPNRDNYYWIEQSEIEDGIAILVKGIDKDGVLTLDDGTKIDPNGDPDYSQGFGNKRMPSVIINPGGGADDPRGEVQIKSRHTGSGWLLEIRRKLNTGDPMDAEFVVGESMPFGLAIFNNAAIGHGMSLNKIMKIE